MWKQSLQRAIRSTDELLKILNISVKDLPVDCNPDFPLRVPLEFIAKMQKGDPNDPLLKQILPLQEERTVVSGYITDPVAEKNANPLPGMIHKYPSRILLTPTGACAVHCRYCFRRHFPYAENTPNVQQWSENIDYIRRNASIKEVILSGGDPLSLSDDKLANLVRMIETIPHVEMLRVHTRFPVMIPSRITQELLQAFNTRLQLVFILHINHPNEIDSALTDAVTALKEQGCTVLNQSALLKGVNNNAQTLIDLSYKLFKAGILPYYINLLDKVTGAHHFDIPREEAKILMQAQREALSGYLMPKWVVDVPGQKSKMPL